MKFAYWLIGFGIFAVTILNGPAFAANPSEERLEVVDLVYEKTDDSPLLQVGDYLITKTVNVWQAGSNGENTRIPLRRIKAGARVKAQIVKQQEGQWMAENLYLLAEPTKEQVARPEKTESAGGGEIYLENGTWKN